MKRLENRTKKIHGVLGLVLNAFYFFVSVHYVVTCHTTSTLWYIGLGVVFAIYVAYCYTFGIKWEIKHIQASREKIADMEKKIESMERNISFLLRNYIDESDNYEDVAEREGFDPITHQRL